MGWSAWQPGFAFDAPAWWVDVNGDPTLEESIAGIAAGRFFSDTPATFDDALAQVPAMFAACVTPDVDTVMGAGGRWMQDIQVSASVFAGPTEGDGQSQVTLAQSVMTFTAPPTIDLPVPTLPPDVTVYEYESDTPTSDGWNDWALTLADDDYEGLSFNDCGVEGDTSVETFFDDWAPYQSYRIVDPDMLSFASLFSQFDPGTDTYPTSAWPTPGTGTETGRVSPILTTSDVTITDAATIGMSEAADMDAFTVLIQPSSLLEGAPTIHTPDHVAGETLRFAEANDAYNGDNRPFRTPTRRYITPRWRYQITDAIYTVGGHWADPNGVQRMRLKDDGVTWIPIVDGLAPPLRP